MSSPAHPEQIDWNAAQRHAVDLVALFLSAVNDQRNRVRALETDVQALMHRLADADRRLEDQRKYAQSLEYSLRQARAQSEEDTNALHERLTEVLERDFRNDNPNAATAAGFSRDEALDEMQTLVSSLWPIIAQQKNRRRQHHPGDGFSALAAAVQALFGGSDVDDEQLALIIGDQHGAEIAGKVRAIRGRLAQCAPTHSWDLGFLPGEKLRQDQEAWGGCPADGVAKYVLRPSYVEGGRVIRKQLVFTVEA